MPRVHRASLLKRWLLGTHQGAVSEKHLDYYLDEFTFRFNRRRSRARGLLFYRLLQNAVQVDPGRTGGSWEGVRGPTTIVWSKQVDFKNNGHRMAAEPEKSTISRARSWGRWPPTASMIWGGTAAASEWIMIPRPLPWRAFGAGGIRWAGPAIRGPGNC